MLGPLYIGILVFILRRYQLKTLGKGKLRNALSWSEWAKRFSLAQCMLSAGFYGVFMPLIALVTAFPYLTLEYTLQCVLLPFTTLYDGHAFVPDFRNALAFFGLGLPPLLPVWMIHRTVVKPLSEKTVPSRTNLALSFVPGLLYVAFVAAAIIGSAWGYGAGSMFNAIFVGMPIFLSMAIASVFSLAVAWHEIDRSS